MSSSCAPYARLPLRRGSLFTYAGETAADFASLSMNDTIRNRSLSERLRNSTPVPLSVW